MPLRSAGMSARQLARIAGSLYLIIILAGLHLRLRAGDHLRVAEGSLCLTLLAGSINVPRWTQQAP